MVKYKKARVRENAGFFDCTEISNKLLLDHCLVQVELDGAVVGAVDLGVDGGGGDGVAQAG